MAPMISIIIPTLNEEKGIEKTLTRLKSTLTLPHEIIVSDGKSTDATITLAQKYADRVVVFPGGHRQTIGEGRNDGAKQARGEFVVFIDADVAIPNPDQFFGTLLNLFAKNTDLVGIIVPVRQFPEERTMADRLGCGWFNIFYFLANNVFKSGNAGGEFQMIRKQAFDSINGFRIDLASGEDNDMFRRLSHIGKTRFVRSLEVYHPCRRAHKIGWFNLIAKSAWSGVSVLFKGKSPYKEWEVIR